MPNDFAFYLAKIYKHSIKIYDYPSELKIATVIVLLKKILSKQLPAKKPTIMLQ